MISALPKSPPLMTVDEFFAWDGGGHQGKLELVDGVVRAQVPASATHSIIQGNLVALIHHHLRARNSPCRVGPEAPVVPRLQSKINARAPDVAVTCAPPSTDKVFINPILTMEVLSPSNEDETWETIRACATIPSLMEIAVVESTSVGARVFHRDSRGAWPETGENTSAGGMLRLASIDAEFAMAEVYRGTYLAGGE